MTSQLRELVYDAIEALITLADALDGDPDLDCAVEDDPRGFDGDSDDDRCAAGDDGCGWSGQYGMRDESDHEPTRQPPLVIDHTETDKGMWGS